MNNDARVQVKFTGDTKNLDGVTQKASKALGSLKGLAKGVGNAFVAGTVTAIGTAKTALISFSKQSLQARAEFEQNIGGTKLLFGQAADYIEKKSKAAYKAAGLSTNEYLHQVNGFAIGLKTSLGGSEKAAAQLADKIITAEADIVAATGNSQEAVQNAFNGIMKGNFTMLDNLQLGIKPTKAGMQEVIDKVNEWNKAQGHATKYQMDNLADMQSAVVDYVKMQGLAGYASREASDTITGSIASAKAAWQNFLTGTGSAKEVAQSFTVVAKNVSNELVKILPYLAEGLGELINGLIPLIPGLVNKLAPVLTKAIMTLLKSVFANTPKYLRPLLIGIGGITAAFKTITVAIKIIKAVKAALLGLKAIITVVNAIMLANPIGIIIAAVAALIAIFVVLWKKCDAFRNFWINLWNGIKSVFSSVINWIKTNWKSILLFLINPFWGAFKYIYDHCKKFRTFIDNFVKNIINFIKSIPSFLAALPGQIIAIINKIPYYIGYAIGWIIGKVILFYKTIWKIITVDIPNAITAAIEWLKELPGKVWTFLVETANKVKTWAIDMAIKAKEAAIQFVNNAITFIKELPSKIWAFLKNTITKTIQWGSDMARKGKQAAINLFNNIVNTIKTLPSRMLSIGKNIVSGLWNGIKSSIGWIKSKVNDFAKGILKGMKDALGIHSPSKETEWMADMLGLGFTKELDKLMPEIERKINSTFTLNPSVTNSANTNLSPNINVINNIDVKQDPLGQMVKNIKTFSGGAKNDYNYGKA